MDYEAIDTGHLANTAASVLQDPDTLVLGDVMKFGLPFRIGRTGAPEATFFGVGPEQPSGRLEVARSAEWIVFAHALTDTALFDGGELGRQVGTYAVVYDDGASVDLPVRERFEIAASPRDRYERAIPLDWGQNPFIAIPELEHVVPHRTHGRFDHVGGRTKEVLDPSTRLPYTLPYRWYLWAWRNPRPEVPVTAIEFRAHGDAHIIVAGVTVSHLAEDPFDRTTNRDVLLTLPYTAHKDDIEQLEVTIDRGTASFPYWIVTAPADLAEAPVVPGWGQGWESTAARTAHVRLTGNPSATVTVTYGGRELARFAWSRLVEGSEVEHEGVRARVVHPDRVWVRTTVRDADTGHPVPCRVSFRSAEGVPFAPHGHPPHINGELATFAYDLGGDVRLGNTSYAYIDGQCEGWLPVGSMIVEIARGFEYQPVRDAIDIRPGQRTLDLSIRRVSRARDHGYVSGDTHGHFVSARGAQFEAAGEDLDIVNLQRTQGGELFTITEEVRREPLISGDDDAVVFVGQENRTGMFGHINLLGVSTPIMPISTGGPDESELGTGLETTLSRWADEAHEQGGIAVLAHFPVPNGEAATLVATGRADALEMIAYDDYNAAEYYRYWNDGYRVPLVGGSDKMTADVPLGIVRTYAGGLGEQATYAQWLDAVRTGDTFVSSGPLLYLDVDGHRPGEVVTGADLTDVTAHVRVQSVFPLSVLEIVTRDGVMTRIELDGATGLWQGTVPLRLQRDTWLAARAFSTGITAGRHHDIYGRRVAAHTSPVYVTSGDAYVVRSRETQQYMATLIAGAVRHIEERARRFWPGNVSHRHGAADHLRYLLEPFEEAHRLVRERLDAW